MDDGIDLLNDDLSERIDLATLQKVPSECRPVVLTRYGDVRM